MLIISVLLCIVISFFGFKNLVGSKVITVLDKSSPKGSIKGHIYYKKYGIPFIYLETMEYREKVVDDPIQDHIAQVRKARDEIMGGFDSSGKIWHKDKLTANFIIYATVSFVMAWILTSLI